MELPTLTFKNICRVCESEDYSLDLTLEENEATLHKLKLCSNIAFETTDAYPKYMCQMCLDNLEIAYAFKKKCEQTDNKFRDLKMKFDMEMSIQENSRDYRRFIVARTAAFARSLNEITNYDPIPDFTSDIEYEILITSSLHRNDSQKGFLIECDKRENGETTYRATNIVTHQNAEDYQQKNVDEMDFTSERDECSVSYSSSDSIRPRRRLEENETQGDVAERALDQNGERSEAPTKITESLIDVCNVDDNSRQTESVDDNTALLSNNHILNDDSVTLMHHPKPKTCITRIVPRKASDQANNNLPKADNFINENSFSNPKANNSGLTESDRLINKCAVCSKNFSNKANLRRHVINIHTNNSSKINDQRRLVKLTDSGNTLDTPSVATYKRSRATVQSNGKIMYKCTLCSNVYRYSHGLRRHLVNFHSYQLQKRVGRPSNAATVDEQNMHKCKFCSNVYLTRQQLRRHLVASHGYQSIKRNDGISFLQSNGKNMHKCTLCSNVYRYSHGLRRHLVNFHGFQKSKNGRRLSSNRNNAASVHSDEPHLFKCKVCSKAFALKQNLRRHIANSPNH